MGSFIRAAVLTRPSISLSRTRPTFTIFSENVVHIMYSTFKHFLTTVSYLTVMIAGTRRSHLPIIMVCNSFYSQVLRSLVVKFFLTLRVCFLRSSFFFCFKFSKIDFLRSSLPPHACQLNATLNHLAAKWPFNGRATSVRSTNAWKYRKRRKQVRRCRRSFL